MRFHLRTLLIVLALAPPALWGGYFAWGRYTEWRNRLILDEEVRQQWIREWKPEPEQIRPPTEGNGVWH